MKYIKHFEDNKIKYIYLIVKFDTKDLSVPAAQFYVLVTTAGSYTKYFIEYFKYYFYKNDNIETEIIERQYSGLYKYDTFIKVIYQTNSEEDAIQKLEVAIEANKYNL